VLWHCWLGHLTRKNLSPYDLYCVGGTLSLTQSSNRDVDTICLRWKCHWIVNQPAAIRRSCSNTRSWARSARQCHSLAIDCKDDGDVGDGCRWRTDLTPRRVGPSGVPRRRPGGSASVARSLMMHICPTGLFYGSSLPVGVEFSAVSSERQRWQINLQTI